ncbi:MAG: hypothetical protein Q4E70_00725 [Candidatus Saccharibacteria bacterium]|nr:hypothetical protein [Candidatus Saccharibacteria bacterium]
MNKKFFFILCLLALILPFTGCADRKVQEEKELKIETTTQEIGKQEKVKVEEKVKEEIKDAEEVTIKEFIIEELPSQESYWNLNYFDLNQYLMDCGAISIATSTENLGPDISIITADFGDFYLEISTSNYEHVANIYIGTSLPKTSGFYREFDYNDDYTNIIVIVDLDDGTMVHQASIEALPDIIKGIKSFKQTTPGERPQIKNCIYP